MCRNPLGGGIFGGALGFARPADGFFGGAVLHPYIDGDGSGRHGAVQIRSSICEDGLVQEDDAVWLVVASMAERPGTVDATVQL